MTAQYHFTGLGRFEPYVGAGAQYINFFNTGTGDNALGATKVNIDPAWGLTLQAGLDFSIGNGWSLNADVKKTFIGRDISWNGTGIGADADLDPWNLLGRSPLPLQPVRSFRTSLPDKVNDKFGRGRPCATPTLFAAQRLPIHDLRG